MKGVYGTVTVAGFLLALLARTEGCMYCASPHKRIRDRFAKLCGEYKTLSGAANCTNHTEADLVKFQFDESTVDTITEKVHRVLRVIEINQTLKDLPKFWDWLYEKKLPQLTKESMCAPKCRKSTKVINCKQCREVKVNCWPMKTCWPKMLDLQESVFVILGVSAGSFLIGFVTLIFESRNLQAKMEKEVE
ncbi:sperm-egg fusion protein TMEM95-like [Rhinoraja longicauda]